MERRVGWMGLGLSEPSDVSYTMSSLPDQLVTSRRALHRTVEGRGHRQLFGSMGRQRHSAVSHYAWSPKNVGGRDKARS